MTSRVSTSPVAASTRRISESPSHVPCHSSPSTHVTPVTKRFDSMVRRIEPVTGSIWWIFRSWYCPTHNVPSAQASPESRAAIVTASPLLLPPDCDGPYVWCCAGMEPCGPDRLTFRGLRQKETTDGESPDRDT